MLGMLVITTALGLLHLLSEPVPSISKAATRYRNDIVLPMQRNGSLEGSQVDEIPTASITNASSDVLRPLLEPARRNPFVGQVSPAPVLKAPPVQAVTQVVVAPPPPPSPTAPPLNLSFAGRVRNPDGKESIYLTWGDKALSAEIGSVLPNGYRVERITADSIDLLYVELNTPARLSLPAAPRYEIR